MSKADKKKTYILDLRDGNMRKITIPAHWKMTFGSVIPFTARGGGNSEPAHPDAEDEERVPPEFLKLPPPVDGESPL